MVEGMVASLVVSAAPAAASCNPPVVPEAPVAVLLPLAGLLAIALLPSLRRHAPARVAASFVLAITLLLVAAHGGVLAAAPCPPGGVAGSQTGPSGAVQAAATGPGTPLTGVGIALLLGLALLVGGALMTVWGRGRRAGA